MLFYDIFWCGFLTVWQVSRLETLISTLYHSLNKRLPVGQHVVIESSTSILLNWLLSAYDKWVIHESLLQWFIYLGISDAVWYSSKLLSWFICTKLWYTFLLYHMCCIKGTSQVIGLLGLNILHFHVYNGSMYCHLHIWLNFAHLKIQVYIVIGNEILFSLA